MKSLIVAAAALVLAATGGIAYTTGGEISHAVQKVREASTFVVADQISLNF